MSNRIKGKKTRELNQFSLLHRSVMSIYLDKLLSTANILLHNCASVKMGLTKF